jgi:hypothetical protein
MFRRRRSAKDFAEEIQAHLELETDELRNEGQVESSHWKSVNAMAFLRSNPPCGASPGQAHAQDRPLSRS